MSVDTGVQFLIGAFGPPAGAERTAAGTEFVFLCPSAKVCSRAEKALMNATAAVGDRVLRAVVGGEPASSAKLRAGYEAGCARESIELSAALCQGGTYDLRVEMQQMLTSLSLSPKKLSEQRRLLVPAGKLPDWIWGTPGLVFVFVVTGTTLRVFQHCLAVAQMSLRVGQLAKVLKERKLGDYSLLSKSDKLLLLDSRESQVVSRDGQCGACVKMGRATVLRNAFFTPEVYSTALALGIEPQSVKRCELATTLKREFPTNFIDPAMTPVVNTAFVAAADLEKYRTMYNDSLGASPAALGSEGDKVWQHCSPLFTMAVRGVPCSKKFSFEEDYYNADSCIATMFYPFFSPAEAMRTYCDKHIDVDTLIGIARMMHKGKSGGSAVIKFLLSDMARVWESVAAAEQDAFAAGTPLFDISRSDACVFNACMRIASLSRSYTAEQRELVEIVDPHNGGTHGSSVRVVRRFVFDLYAEFNSVFVDVKIADLCAERKREDFCIVDAPGLVKYTDLADAGLLSHSVVLAPSADAAAALKPIVGLAPVSVAACGRLVFTGVAHDFASATRNVVLTFVHLWDSVELVALLLAVRRGFPSAQIWLFGDGAAVAEAVCARRAGAMGSLYHMLLDEAQAAAALSFVDALRLVPRAALYAGPLFFDPLCPEGNGVLKNIFSGTRFVLNACGDTFTCHLPQLLENGFDLSNVETFDAISCVGQSTVFGSTGGDESMLASLRARRVSFAVVVDGSAEYLHNVRCAVDELPRGSAHDLVTPGTVLRCRTTQARFAVDSILKSDGQPGSPFRLSKPPPKIVLRLYPVPRPGKPLPIAMARAEPVLVTEDIAPFAEEFEIASVLPIAMLPPSVDVVIFLSPVFEQHPTEHFALPARGAFMPAEKSQEYDALSTTCFFHADDRKELLRALEPVTTRALVHAARTQLVLAYPDWECSGFLSDLDVVELANESFVSHHAAISRSSLPVEPCKIIAECRMAPIAAAEYNVTQSIIPPVADVDWRCVELALSVAFAPPKAPKSRSRAQSARSARAPVQDPDEASESYSSPSSSCDESGSEGHALVADRSQSVASTPLRSSAGISLDPSYDDLFSSSDDASPHASASAPCGAASNVSGRFVSLFGPLSDESDAEDQNA